MLRFVDEMNKGRPAYNSILDKGGSGGRCNGPFEAEKPNSPFSFSFSFLFFRLAPTSPIVKLRCLRW